MDLRTWIINSPKTKTIIKVKYFTIVDFFFEIRNINKQVKMVKRQEGKYLLDEIKENSRDSRQTEFLVKGNEGSLPPDVNFFLKSARNIPTI